MLTTSEFATWFLDYRYRFPAVGDYVDRQALPGVLLDTWHANVSAFDVDVLRAVTAGMLSGDFEPIQNVQLGTFGAEVRKLCRQVLDSRRERQHRKQWQKADGPSFTPLLEGTMLDMYHACCAVYELAPDADDDVIVAAITLADDHTVYERDRSHADLAGVGLTWEQVQEVAGRIKRTGGKPILPEVPQ